MRVGTVVPIKESFHIDLVADGKSLNSLVHIGILAAKVRFYREGICIRTVAYLEIKVIAL